MNEKQKVIIVMPAYNAAETLKKTYDDIDFSIVDDVVLVDDCSTDKTVLTAEKLGIKHIIKHDIPWYVVEGCDMI